MFKFIMFRPGEIGRQVRVHMAEAWISVIGCPVTHIKMSDVVPYMSKTL